MSKRVNNKRGKGGKFKGNSSAQLFAWRLRKRRIRDLKRAYDVARRRTSGNTKRQES